ncbi:MAG: hypothetical protein NTW95_06760 [Candidatus Aminicenantes bacterium]|nr:hypothetical protein [Candidatus Aminicenantes bacterium]
MTKIVLLIFSLIVIPAFRSEAAEVEKAVQAQDLNSLQELEKTARKESLAFLCLIKKMEPEKKNSSRWRKVEKGKVVKNRCKVYDALDENARTLYSPRLNEEFTIIEKNDEFFRILLPGGREGWIEEKCLQTFSVNEEEIQTKFKGVANSQINQFMTTAGEIYARLARQKDSAEKIYEKYRDLPLSGPRTIKEIRSAYGKISRYFQYGDYFYREYVRDRKLLFSAGSDALAKLSAWGELFLGTSSHVTEMPGSQSEENKGGSHDISLGASYALKENSQMELSFSSRREIIQTPFSNTAIQAGYSLRGSGKMNVHAAFSYNSYNDETNDFNNFSQVALKTDASFDLRPGQTLRLDYSFANNSFANDQTAGFANHALAAGLNFQVNKEAGLNLQLRSNLETSDSAFHKFIFLSPSIGYERTRANSRLLLKFAYELISFKELELKNFNRISLQLDSAGRKGDLSRNAGLFFIYKTFPNNDQSSYLQLGGKYATALNGLKTRLFSISVNSNLFTANGANSYSEMKLDYGGTSQGFFSNLTLYGRFWHSPEGTGSGSVKPHVIDLYAAAGLRSAFIKIGPVIALHALASSGDGTSFFKRDGNLFRIGALAEAEFPLPARGRLTLNAAYEYGFVYNDEISINLGSGEITSGDVVQRHPTTFRINGQASLPILPQLEFISRVDFYKISTDMDPSISINPIIANRMFLLLFGVRYRYN